MYSSNGGEIAAGRAQRLAAGMGAGVREAGRGCGWLADGLIGLGWAGQSGGPVCAFTVPSFPRGSAASPCWCIDRNGPL